MSMLYTLDDDHFAFNPYSITLLFTIEGPECGDKRKRRLASETDGGYHPKRRSTRVSLLYVCITEQCKWII